MTLQSIAYSQPRIIIFSLFILFSIINADDLYRSPGYCVIGGDCGKNPKKDRATQHNMPCLRNATKAFSAETLTPSTWSKFQENCPDIVQGRSKEEVLLCCREENIIDMVNGFKQAVSVFGRCPACWYNFRANSCQATCHPDQSLFINPTEYLPTEDKKETAVSKYEFYVSENLITNWFKSCENVMYPQIQDTVIAITCNKPKTECTPADWLNFQGSNALNPIDITVVPVAEKDDNPIYPDTLTFEEFKEIQPEMLPDSIQGENYKTQPETNYAYCNETIPWSANNSEICSCQDCPTRDCPVPIFQIDDTEVQNIGWFVALGLWIVFVALFVFSNRKLDEKAWVNIRNDKNINCDFKSDSSNSSNPDKIEKTANYLEVLYYKMSVRLGNAFQYWAENIVCKYPISTLITIFILVIICCAGFPKTEFTTDPVELWVDPESRNAQELQFFNEKFTPFYRSEIVIATLKPEFENQGYDYFTCSGQNIHFTSILNETYLKSFFELQERIFTMSDKVNVVEACFKPLAPDYEYCATQSIYQWWQNDIDVFEQVFDREDYATCVEDPENPTFGWQDHFLGCATNPSSIDDGASSALCLGEYGGPAFPFVALGGYDKNTETGISSYNTATALIMSLELDNFADRNSVGFEKAALWESDFINFMEKEAKNSKYFDIAYFSEIRINSRIDSMRV